MTHVEASDQHSNDEEVKRTMEEVLALLPADVRQDLNDRRINIGDDGFMEAVMDHIQRLQGVESLKGRLISGELLQVQRKLKKIVRMQDPDALGAATVRHTTERISRNDLCPCGSGRKYKKCCMNKNR